MQSLVRASENHSCAPGAKAIERNLANFVNRTAEIKWLDRCVLPNVVNLLISLQTISIDTSLADSTAPKKRITNLAHQLS